jgi:hypothetical protein
VDICVTRRALTDGDPAPAAVREPTPAAPAVASSVIGRHHRGARTVARPVPFARTLAGTPMARRTASDLPVAALNWTERSAS